MSAGPKDVMNFQTDARRPVLALGLAALAAATVLAAGAGVSKQAADQFQRKLQAIHAHAMAATGRPLRTAFTEQEVNAYLALDAAGDLPHGILDPRISLLGPGRLSGRAIVDLDAVRRGQPASGMLNPMGFLSGKLPVMVIGVLHTQDGRARFELQSAEVGGVTVPTVVIQELLAYYARTPGTPNGVSLNSSFPLPDRIQQIDVQRGQAIVIQ